MYALVFFILLFTTMPLSANVAGVFFYTIDLALFPLVAVIGFRYVISSNIKKVSWSIDEKLLIVFVLLVGISAFLSVNVGVSFDDFLLWLRYAFLYWALRHYFTSAKGSDVVFYHFAIVAISIAVIIGILQLITASKVGVLTNYFGATVDETSRVFNNRRISGTSSNSNVYGAWLTVYIVALMAWWQARGSSKITGMLVLFTGSLLIFATLSKASVLFFLAALLLYVTSVGSSRSSFSNKILIFLIGTAVLVSGLLFTPIGADILDRFIARTVTTDSASYSVRLDVLSTIPVLLSDLKYAVIGTGANVFFETLEYENIYHNIYASWVDAANKRAGIHNIFLNFLTSFGVIASFIFFKTYTSFVLMSKNILKVSSRPGPAVAFIVLLGSVIPSQLNTVVWSVNFFPILIFWAAYVSSQIQQLEKNKLGRR